MKTSQQFQITKILFVAIALSLFIGSSIQFSSAATDDENAQELCTLDTCGPDQEINPTDTDPNDGEGENGGEVVMCTNDTWSCGAWSECSNQTQSRTCTKTFECEAVQSTAPVESRYCGEPAPIPTPPTPSPVPQTRPVYTPAPVTQPASQTETEVSSESGSTGAESSSGESEIVSVDGEGSSETTVGGVTANNEAVEVLASQLDAADQTIEKELANKKAELISQGTTEAEAERIVTRLYMERHAEEKVELIRKISQDTFGVTINDNAQDSNGDGVSDELAIELGLDPNSAPSSEDLLTPADQKLFRTDLDQINVKCSISAVEGTKLSSKGFTILSACPLNREYALFVRDADGNEVQLDRQRVGDNHKVIFNVEKPFTTGEYSLQIRPVTGEPGLSSDRIKVLIVDESELDLTQPVVRKIEDIAVGNLKDIKIFRTKDGRIHVTGIADVSSTVIATFQSAIFNSALLADTQSGAFEVVSSSPLENGAHTVTVFSTRTEDASQSAPVRISFEIVDGHGSAFGSQFPTAAIASLIVLLLAIGTFVALRMMREKVPADGMMMGDPSTMNASTLVGPPAPPTDVTTNTTPQETSDVSNIPHDDTQLGAR